MRIVILTLLATLVFAAFAASEADAHEVYSYDPATGSCVSELGYEAVCGGVVAPTSEQTGDVEGYILFVFGADGPAAVAVATCESGLDPSAYNPSGASGVFQIMPSTALAIGADPALLFDAKYNIDTAYRLYQQQGWSPWVCGA